MGLTFLHVETCVVCEIPKPLAVAGIVAIAPNSLKIQLDLHTITVHI